MKRHRRVEITTFQRKVTIVSDELPKENVDLSSGDLNHPRDPLEPISPDSDEGRQILADAIRMLSERLISSSDSPADPLEGDAERSSHHDEATRN
jgi:hypothetical protein